MNTRRLRLVRPRWTMGTMLLIVGWSAVVVWLNVRPRIEYLPIPGQEDVVYHASFGCPWTAKRGVIHNVLLSGDRQVFNPWSDIQPDHNSRPPDDEQHCPHRPSWPNQS